MGRPGPLTGAIVDKNLTDWLGAHPWSWWLTLVLLCLAVELLERRWYAAACAMGAGVAAVIAWVAPTQFWYQAGFGAAAALTGVLVVSRLPAGPAAPARRRQ
ncbi:hypothetical protein CGZ97_12725 [Enemella evansiae]|nr:hypothetical protein CGZ97_12725 [Enemella evansiae]OYO08438.1 hypothetical protein BI335_19195 [Enemella evansiae]